MSDHMSVHQKVEFRTDKAIFAGVPVALLLGAAGLAMLVFFGSEEFESFLAGAILLVAGFGWTTFAAWRKIRPGKPIYTLTPQGILYRIPWVKQTLIPWREVRDIDSVTMAGPGVGLGSSRYSIFKDVTTIDVSKEFYEKNLHLKSSFLRGPGWAANFNPKGDLVQVALHYGLVGVTAEEMREAVEARWHAFGDRSRSAASASQPVGRREGSAKVRASGGGGLRSLWTLVKYAVPLIAIGIVGSNALGLWSTDGQIAERHKQQEWREFHDQQAARDRELEEARRKRDAAFEETFRRFDEQSAKTEKFWKEFEQQVMRPPGARDGEPVPQQPTQPGGHREAVLSIDVAPDGRSFLTASGDRTIKLWDTSKPDVVRTLATHRGYARTVRYAADGRSAISASDGGEVLVHDLVQGGPPRRLDAAQFGDANALAITADGQRAVTVHDKGGAVLVWDVPAGTHREMATGDRMRQQAVAIAPDGKRAMTGGVDGKPRLWDLDAGTLLRTFGEHKGPIYSVVITSDGASAITGGGDSSMRMWDLATGQQVRQFSGHIDTVYSVALAPDGKHVLSGSLDVTARTWEIATGREVVRFEGHRGNIYSVAFAPDGSVLTGSRDRSIRLWRPDGSLIREFPGAPG